MSEPNIITAPILLRSTSVVAPVTLSRQLVSAPITAARDPYQLWLAEGNEGTRAEFLLSLKGEQGDKGDQGEKGDKGNTGDNGVDATLDPATLLALSVSAGIGFTRFAIAGLTRISGEEEVPFDFADLIWVGMFNGRRYYTGASGTDYEGYWDDTEGNWKLQAGESMLWQGYGDVTTPDLCNGWVPRTSAAGFGQAEFSGSTQLQDVAKVLSSTIGRATLAEYGITDAAAANHSHAYSAITDKPATFAPVTGTTAGTACAGNDARLPTSGEKTALTNLTTNGDTVVADFEYTSNTVGASGSNGVWNYTLPTAVKMLEFVIVSAGSGGGSGRVGASNSNRYGGGGGAGGSVTRINIPCSFLASRNLVVNVGLGGAGGNPVTTSDTNGNDGQVGGQSSVTDGTKVIALCGPTTSYAAGKGGTATAGTAGLVGGAVYTDPHGAGGAGGLGDGAAPPIPNYVSPHGGGGGGGVSSGGVIGRGGPQNAGGAGLVWGGIINGSRAGSATDGGSGSAPTGIPHIPVCVGGWGGNGGISNNGGAGTTSVRGGGGAGGGAGTNGKFSGQGGKGGDGFVRIIMHY